MRPFFLNIVLLSLPLASIAVADDPIPTDFKSADINAEIKKIPELESTLRSLMEARMKVARGELIDKLKEYQTKATQAGDLDEALKVRNTIEELEKLQEAKEKFVANDTTKEVKATIPRDAVKFGKSRYYVYVGLKVDDRLMNGDEAQKFCEEQGGHLARIDSVEEHAFLARLVQPLKSADGTPTWVMVDGNDMETKGKYVYSNGEPVKYFKWDNKKPTGRQDCRRIGLWTGNGLFWDAIGTAPPFLCEWD